MEAPPPRGATGLPAAKQAELQRAKRQEWLTLALRASVVAVMFAALGGVHALTAVWLKSIWALLPPASFLVACPLERRPPTPRFAFGFYRAASVAFLLSALALAGMGLYMLYAGGNALVHLSHPGLAPIAQARTLAGWNGWPMIAALAYHAAVPFVVGGERAQRAIDIHDKGLYADASMGRVNWLAGAAGTVGVLGVGFGLWWADFIATLVIGADVLWHSSRHLVTAVCDLIDEVPRRLGSDRVDPIGDDIRDYLESLPWVARARVRLREQGRLITGVALICPATTDDLLARCERAHAEIAGMDWRLVGVGLVLLRRAAFERAAPTARGRSAAVDYGPGAVD